MGPIHLFLLQQWKSTAITLKWLLHPRESKQKIKLAAFPWSSDLPVCRGTVTALGIPKEFPLKHATVVTAGGRENLTDRITHQVTAIFKKLGLSRSCPSSGSAQLSGRLLGRLAKRGGSLPSPPRHKTLWEASPARLERSTAMSNSCQLAFTYIH